MKELTIINEQQVLGKHFAIYGTPADGPSTIIPPDTWICRSYSRALNARAGFQHGGDVCADQRIWFY